MGRPPAYLFVVRHGARLDQADKNWHVSSTTPYDPPLTYGGWLQSQAAGAKIASILRRADAEQSSSPASSPSRKKKKKKYKIAIHSSPFLRCVQTSVGISAGLAQPASPTELASDQSPASAHSANSSPRFSSSADIPIRDANRSSGTSPRKTPVRLDAFLGEWLNPEYFESISSPPGSAQLLSAAKVSLLRKETISIYDSPRPHAGSVSSNSHGQLWSSPKFGPVPARAGSVDSVGLDNMPAMAGALPRNRADSAASGSSQKGGTLGEQLQHGRRSPRADDGYVAPTPGYAISMSDKIPDGYVAHARDACTAVDYQWDSMSQWGDGGELGEEWVTMHRRFRQGFQHLVDWYSTAEDPAHLVTKTAQSVSEEEEQEKSATEEDEEEETVAIVVSHGAGCNAMIGAITRQPVLMDVGIATVTMASRKPDEKLSPGALTTSDWGTLAIDQFYDLKIQASNDHLRDLRTSSGAGLSRAASVSSGSGHSPYPANSHPRGRVSTGPTYSHLALSIDGSAGSSSSSCSDMRAAIEFSTGASRSTSANANLASMRKTSQTGTTGLAFPSAPPTLSAGLAFPPAPPTLNMNTEHFNMTGSRVIGGVGGTSPSIQPFNGLWAPNPTASPIKTSINEDDDEFPDFDGTKRFGGVSPWAEGGDTGASGSASQPVHSPSDSSSVPPLGLPSSAGGVLKAPHRLQEISRPTSRDGEPTEEPEPIKFPTDGTNGLWGS